MCILVYSLSHCRKDGQTALTSEAGRHPRRHTLENVRTGIKPSLSSCEGDAFRGPRAPLRRCPEEGQLFPALWEAPPSSSGLDPRTAPSPRPEQGPQTSHCSLTTRIKLGTSVRSSLHGGCGGQMLLEPCPEHSLVSEILKLDSRIFQKPVLFLHSPGRCSGPQIRLWA